MVREPSMVAEIVTVQEARLSSGLCSQVGQTKLVQAMLVEVSVATGSIGTRWAVSVEKKTSF